MDEALTTGPAGPSLFVCYGSHLGLSTPLGVPILIPMCLAGARPNPAGCVWTPDGLLMGEQASCGRSLDPGLGLAPVHV